MLSDDCVRSGTEDDGEVVLDLLQDEGGAVTVGELAEVLTREQTDQTPADVTTSGDVHEALVEEVLPALDADDCVEFDSDRGVVSTTSDARLATRILDLLRG